VWTKRNPTVKAEIIDISLEDQDVQATLDLPEGPSVEVYPPIPAILTYDVGVLRHFIFIRRNQQEGKD
jgi:hypothetical protein